MGHGGALGRASERTGQKSQLHVEFWNVFPVAPPPDLLHNAFSFDPPEMPMFLRSARAAVAALALGWPLSSIAAPQGDLRIGMPTLNEQAFLPQATVGFAVAYLSPMFDFLVKSDKEGNFDPKQSLAEKWETSADQLSWTFTIRQGVKFHNGDPLTADDVKYTLDMTTTAKNVAGRRADFEAFFKSVEVTSPNTVKVNLKKPWPYLLFFLSDLIGVQGMVVPKKYIEEKGEANFLANPVGSGPYKFVENKLGSSITFEALEGQWRIPEPKYKRIIFRSLPEQGTRVAALRNGEVDIASIGLSDGDALKKAGLNVLRKDDGLLLDFTFLRVNEKEGLPTNDERVRKALLMGINRKEIVDQILYGEGKAVGATLALFTWSFDYKPFDPTPYNPAEARKLLAAAGYPNGFEIALYSFTQRLPESKLINETIAGYWEQIGVKTKILEMDYNAFRNVWTKKNEPPGPAAFTMDWPNRPFYSWRGKYHSSSMFSSVKDPALDKMIEAAEAELDLEAYKPKSQAIMQYIIDKGYSSGLATTHELFAANKNVPAWSIGRSFGDYRFEYVGQK